CTGRNSPVRPLSGSAAYLLPQFVDLALEPPFRLRAIPQMSLVHSLGTNPKVRPQGGLRLAVPPEPHQGPGFQVVVQGGVHRPGVNRTSPRAVPHMPAEVVVLAPREAALALLSPHPLLHGADGLCVPHANVGVFSCGDHRSSLSYQTIP